MHYCNHNTSLISEKIVPVTNSHIENLYVLFLQSPSGVEQYINAVRVDSSLRQESYIITEHPMMNTIERFWRLVVKKKCPIIVLLNNDCDEVCNGVGLRGP